MVLGWETVKLLSGFRFFSVSYYLCVGKTNHGQPRKGWFTELLLGVKLTLIWTQNDPHDSHSRNFRWIRYLLEHVWTVKTKPASRAIKLVGLISNWHSTHGELQLEKTEKQLSERMQIRSWLEMIQSVLFFLVYVEICPRSMIQHISPTDLGGGMDAMDAFQNAIDGLKDLKAGGVGWMTPRPPAQGFKGRTLVKAVSLSSLKENWWL